MNCDTAKRCFSEAFDARLVEPLGRRFEEHLSECDPCRTSFRDYRALFSAVRSVPSTHTQRELPLPTSSTSFGVRGQGMRIPRGVAAAAVFILVVGASYTGFHYGQANGPVAPDAAAPVTEVANVELPSKPAGKALRRLTNSVGVVGPILNAAAHDPSPRTLGAVNRAVRALPLERDAGYLRQMDSASLGSFKDPIHRFADEAIRIHEAFADVQDVQDESMGEWFDSLRRRVTERDLVTHYEMMRRISKPYDVEPFRSSSPGADVEDHLMSGLLALVNEDHDQALVFLGQALGSSELGTFVEELTLSVRQRGVARGNRFEIIRGGAKGILELHVEPASPGRGRSRSSVIIQGRRRETLSIPEFRRRRSAVIVPDEDARRRRLAQDL